MARKPTTRKRLLFIITGLLLFFTNPFLINRLYKFWENTDRAETHKTYETGIILSGFMNKDDSYNSHSFGNATDRLTEGLMLYKNGIIKRIIISSGSGSLVDDTRESVLAKIFWVKYCAVPDSAVLIDTISRNTYENAVESKKLVESTAIKDLIMITSAWHMRRAEGGFKKMGLDVDVHPTDGIYREEKYSPSNTIIPDTENITRWEILFHEISGIIIYKLIGYI